MWTLAKKQWDKQSNNDNLSNGGHSNGGSGKKKKTNSTKFEKNKMESELI